MHASEITGVPTRACAPKSGNNPQHCTSTTCADSISFSICLALMRRSMTMPLLCLLCITLIPLVGAPEVSHDFTLQRLAFASCSKQHRAQPLWAPLLRHDPQVFLWTGDAVYLNTTAIAALREAYAAQRQHPDYQALLRSAAHVYGVYDDHDYGINDGGGAHWTAQRQRLFLDFIDAPATVPQRHRRGVYSAQDYGQAPRKARVILLDTRSLRDPHYSPHPRLTEFLERLPEQVSAKLLAIGRAAYTLVGLNRGYAGDVLGEEQWAWLEQQLEGSDAAVHIVVSSIQVSVPSLSAVCNVVGFGTFPRFSELSVRCAKISFPWGGGGTCFFFEIRAKRPF